MLFLENLKPLKIYKKPLFLPTIPTDKKKRSAIFLLTPNYESSKATMTSNLFVNRLRFASYYIEKDLTYFISSKAMDKVEDVTETYVRDFTEYDLYQSLCEMSAAERNALKDSTFGIPKKRKYPLNDESHVRSAIRFFNYVDKEDEATLARNIKKAIKKFNMKVSVGPKNRFSNYYHPKAVTEEYEYISEDKLPTKERNALEDSSFGVPSKRKFPLNDKDHVKAAIRFFNKVDPEDEKTLARNLNKAINKFFSKEDRPKVGKNNRFAKYYAGPLTESSIYEGKVYDLGHDDYCYKFFDGDNEVCEVCIDYGDRYDPDNYIYELHVNPAYQKQGIGTALLEYATEVLGGDTLCVEKNNKVALHMYEDAGFEITGTNKQDQYIMSLGEDKLYAKERNALKDSTFGLPEKRKYPLNDESHVRSAIRFFNKVDKEDEAELARNIKKAIKKFGMKVKVGPENRFSNYYTSPATESALMEVSVLSNIDKDYESKGKKNLSSYRKESITKSMAMRCKDLKHVRLDDETCAFFDSDNLVGYVAVEHKDDYYTWITALEVTKDYQGYGLGEQLLKYAIDNMNANALSVNKNNKVAYEMYKKAGFYVFDDTDTMYFMTTDPVKAELNEIAINAHELYHVSPTYKDIITLNPSIPDNYMTKNGYENNTIKRVCFSNTINGCLIAMSKNLEGKELYVYSPIEDADVYTPTEKELPDQKYTGEVWIKKPIKARCIGKIVVGKAKDEPITYTYGDNNTADLYDWNYIMTKAYKECTLTEEGLSDPLEMIKDLNKELNSYKYGYKIGDKVIKNGDEFDKNYRIQTPEQFEKSKCGVCYDFCLYQDKKLKDLGIPHDNYFIMIPDNPNNCMTHTFTVARINGGDYVYLESAFGKTKGVHRASNLNDIFNYIVSNMISDDKEHDYFIVKLNSGALKPGLTCEKFINSMSKKPTIVDSEFKGGKIVEKGIVDESYGYLGPDEKEIYNKYTNTPDTAIISASAIVINDEGEILIEDHEKCGGWSLPGGKEECETIEETICRELDEELNIGVDKSDLKLLCVNTFLCEYPNGSQSYTWFKDYCFYVKNYVGNIENKELEKHNKLAFVSFEDLVQLKKDNEPMSELLENVIDYILAYNRSDFDLATDKITYSGYTTDIEPVSCVINIDFYKKLLNKLGFEISNTYDPKINIIVCDRENVEYGIQQNGEEVINIFIPAIGDKKYNWSIESYKAYIANMMAVGVMEAKFQNIPIGIIRCFARYILDLGNDETERKFMDEVLKDTTAYGMLQAIDKGEITPDDFYRKARKFGCNDKCFSDKGSYVNEAKALDAEHLTNAIKYRTSTKQKKALNSLGKSTPNNKEDKEPDNVKTDEGIKQIDVSQDTKEVSKDKITEEMIQALENDEYIIYGDYVTFFTEDSSNDTALRKILWSERMIKRKEVVALLDRVKADCPFIKYAYPELNRYQQKNLFVDLYYYNQAFFKNNEWRALKAFNLYKDLLDRLINDKRIKNAGYERRTVFIPINDWHKNPSTRMWMYKEDLNPISVIYQLMMTNPSALQKLFKDVGVVFFSKDKYFTVDFSQPIDKKTALKFRTFITKINKGEEFDSEDVDSTENTPSKESIKTTIMDDIEDAKGVDLTSANNKVQSEPKEGPNASIGDKPPTRTMAVKTPEAKKEERNKPAVKATAAKPIKPAVTAASLTAAASKKYEKQAEKLVKQQNDEVKDVEKTMSKTTVNKPVTDDKIKQDEEVQKAIVRSIDSHVYDKVDVTDVDDVYDDMDYDDTLKDLLVSLDSMKDDSVNISQARADRMGNLDRELLDKSLKGRTIREILDKDSDPTKPIEMPKTDLKVGSPNPEWKDLHYMNFDKTYDLEKDIVNAFEHFTTTSRPMAIRNITAEDNSSSEDYIDTYTCEYEDYRGKRYTIKLDIPKVKNERFVLRGNKRMLQTQFFNMPIVKTADDVCQIVTNYKKIIISRYNTATGKSLPNVARLIKAADKYSGRRIKFTPGDNTLICTKYNLPIDYIDLSTAFSKIETDEYVIYFNQDEIRKQYEVNDANGTPFAIDKLHDSLIYYPNDETRPFIDTLMAMITWKSDGTIDEKFDELYKSMKAPAKGTYTRAKIMGAEIPLVVVCAYHDGLTTVMKKSNIMYELVDKLTSEIRSDINKDWVRFKDGYLVFNVDYNSSLLMNGLKDCDTIQYSMMDIDDKNMYLDFLDNFGGRIKADGLENFYDCEIDPISKETLAYYKLPTEYVSVLLYANRLLSDNKFIKHTDASSRRARRFELIAAYTYQVLAEAYSSYSTSVKHNRNGATFSCKQSAVIDKILQDPTSSDYSTINMLNDIESTNAITTKGLSGLNADRSYSLDKRTFDDSMLDVVGMSTGFSQNTGITRQATMDMNIKGERGYVKDIHGNTKDMNTAKTLTATEAVVPLSTTHDDPFRVAMTFIQSSKHAVRTEHSDPLLVTNGADEALPYMCSDQFAYKAKQDGTIKELDDQGMIVEYDDGSKEYVDLSETIEKNSDGGFYVPLKLDADSKLKVGSKVKKNQILAYDNSSLSNSAGEDDNLAYNVGTLCKIAIINTDEGFEDSGIVTEDLAEKLTTKIIYMEDCILDKNTNIYNMAKVGQKVEQGDTLLVWQTPYDEEEVNNLLKALADDREAISELGRHTVKSEVTGKVVGIKMYRTVELDDLSDSLKKALSDYEKPISDLKKRLEDEDIDTSTLPANYPLKPAGKLKKAGDGVLIEFYVEYDDIVGVGDKITYNAANKAVIKNVIPRGKEPYTDFRPNEKISALVSSTSIAKRMVTSTRVYGYLQKLMVELDRSCKDLAGIPYDDSTV